MSWLYLIAAGIFEVCWAVGLKYSQGFTKPLATFATITCMLISFYLLSLALKFLPLGTAYAVWTGIGTLGTVLLGIILFQEPTNPARLFCIMLIVLGVAGLKVLAEH